MHQPLSRRTALKASGVALALPLLESMSPAIGAEPVAPRRLVMICNTLGLHGPALYPQKTGREYESTEYLDLLQEHRDSFTLLSGLSHPDQNGKQPHDTEMTWLSSARNPGMAGFKNTISIDQFAARELGYVTRFPSIALSTNTQKSQAYTSNGVMIPAFDRPSRVFSQLFLQGGSQELQRRHEQLAQGQSILDFVADQARALKHRSSASDRRQLDEYFESVREAEQELTEAGKWLDKPKPEVDAKTPSDISNPSDLIGRTRAMLKLIPLILRTDSSRIISMVIQDHFVAPQIDGVSAEHHNLSHHGQDPDKIKQLKIIESELLSCFAGLLTSLRGPSEEGQNLLDHTSVIFGSNLGNANAHDPRNLPILVAGGDFDHQGYLSYDRSNNTPLCNLFVRLLRKLEIEADTFGTSSGCLDFA